MHIYIYTHIHTYIYIYIHVFMYTYICIYIYIRAIQLTYTHMGFIFSMMKEPAILVQSFVYPTTIWNLPFLYSCYLLIYTCVYIYIWTICIKIQKMHGLECHEKNFTNGGGSSVHKRLQPRGHLLYHLTAIISEFALQKSSSHFITTLVV